MSTRHLAAPWLRIAPHPWPREASISQARTAPSVSGIAPQCADRLEQQRDDGLDGGRASRRSTCRGSPRRGPIRPAPSVSVPMTVVAPWSSWSRAIRKGSRKGELAGPSCSTPCARPRPALTRAARGARRGAARRRNGTGRRRAVRVSSAGARDLAPRGALVEERRVEGDGRDDRGLPRVAASLLVQRDELGHRRASAKAVSSGSRGRSRARPGLWTMTIACGVQPWMSPSVTEL